MMFMCVIVLFLRALQQLFISTLVKLHKTPYFSLSSSFFKCFFFCFTFSPAYSNICLALPLCFLDGFLSPDVVYLALLCSKCTSLKLSLNHYKNEQL